MGTIPIYILNNRLSVAKVVKVLHLCKGKAQKLRRRADKAARPLCTRLFFQSGTAALHTTSFSKRRGRFAHDSVFKAAWPL